MSLPSCFDCCFFVTLDADARADDLEPAEREKCLQGRCRRNPPTVGHFRGEDKDLEYDYGQWPLVLSCDWCGAFEPCRRALRQTETSARPAGIGISKMADAQPESIP